MASAQGIYLPGAGANHLSMGGASTALATDAAGAMYWNPATITGLQSSEAVIGADMIIPYDYLSSTVPKKTFGKFPINTQSGTTFSDAGVTTVPTFAVVYNEDDTYAYGFGLSTVAQQKTNYPTDFTNPLLNSQGPLKQFVFGPESSSLLILQMTPTVSAQVTDHLSIGISPTIDVASVSFDPAFFGPATQVHATDPKQFPTGAPTQQFWGAGARVGFSYRICDGFSAGFSYTTPQWFQVWRFTGRNAAGAPISYQTGFSLPQIFSAGLAYDGGAGLILAADVRYFDYANTALLGTSAQDVGAGWRGIWSAALGARYQLTKCLSVQAGYIYCQDPVPPDLSLFNVQLPAMTQHTVTTGLSYDLNDWAGMSLAYIHGFRNYIAGTMPQAFGATTMINSAYDSIAFNLHFRFGARVTQ